MASDATPRGPAPGGPTTDPERAGRPVEPAATADPTRGSHPLDGAGRTDPALGRADRSVVEAVSDGRRRRRGICEDAARRAPTTDGKLMAPKGSKGGAKASGDDTRARLLEATRRCLQAEGIAGASARAIARHGDLNQALVFYHFGSVDGLLQAAARDDAAERAELYRDRLADVTTLAGLVAVGRQIHEVEQANGSAAVLAQLLAGSVSSPTLAEAIHDGMTTWTDLVSDALGRVVAGTPLGGVVPLDDLAFAISSLFLGMELMGALDPDVDRVAGLFASLGPVSQVLDALLGAKPTS